MDINSASVAEMTRLLHGVGVARATAIVAARPFVTPHDLVNRRLLSEQAYQRIADRISVGAPADPVRYARGA